MTLEFLKNILSIPTCSKHEDFIIESIEGWCATAGIKCKKDSKGNLFLTKGSPNGYYPACTSHLDTVHNDQKDLVEKRQLMTVVEQGDKLSIDGTGIGADCKAGVAICLSLMYRLPAAKCALYVEEEIGMTGSKGSDMSFFDDCCWVIGFDSPERNRAAKACSGTVLYSEEFFNKYVKDICADHGLTDFRWEPWTDVLEIRAKTHLECMNVGNGGYNPHSRTEYVKASETMAAEEMGYALMTSVSTDVRHVSDTSDEEKRHEEEERKRWSSYSSGPSDIWSWIRELQNKGEREHEQGRRNAAKQSEFHWGDDGMTLGDLAGSDDLAAMEHGDADMATFDWTFIDADSLPTFEQFAAEDHLEIDIDGDGYNSMSVYGSLGELKKAFVLVFNIENATRYYDFSKIPEGDAMQFWDSLEFDDYIDVDDQMDQDSIPPDETAAGDIKEKAE